MPGSGLGAWRACSNRDFDKLSSGGIKGPFAEVDKRRWGGVLEKEGWEKATGYTDWREMFQHHGKNLDVVFITNDPSINELAWREPRRGWGPMEQKI